MTTIERECAACGREIVSSVDTHLVSPATWQVDVACSVTCSEIIDASRRANEQPRNVAWRVMNN